MGNEHSPESYLEITLCAHIQLAQLLLPQVLHNVFKLPTVQIITLFQNNHSLMESDRDQMQMCIECAL